MIILYCGCGPHPSLEFSMLELRYRKPSLLYIFNSIFCLIFDLIFLFEVQDSIF